MTARDFVAIAAVIASGDGRTDFTARHEGVEGLADYFASRNPRFDRQRFLRACKVAAS